MAKEFKKIISTEKKIPHKVITVKDFKFKLFNLFLLKSVTITQ